MKIRKKAHPNSLREAAMIREDMIRIGIQTRDAYDLSARLDADETNMLALQLEQMRTRVYEDEYPEQKARRFIPVTNDVDPGAETYSYERSEEVGEAKIITNGADDLPTVDTSASKESHRLVTVGDAYHYTLQDMMAAAFAGKPLSAKKARAARRAWERKLDSIAATGAPEFGIATGFLNDANVGIESLAAAGTWSTKSGSEILDDLNALSAGVIDNSKELYSPNVVLMPTAQYLRINHTRMSVDNPESVLEAFLRANPWVEDVQPWNKLDGAGGGGDDRIVAYRRDPEVAELVIAQEFTVLPPQRKNLAFQVLAHGRTGGCTVMRPLGMRYMDGV